MSQTDKAKPAEILEKIISAKVAKVINEVTLTGQPYALDTDKSVDQVLKAAEAEVVSFSRIAVGEVIEKVVEDYAAEVAKAQPKSGRPAIPAGRRAGLHRRHGRAPPRLGRGRSETGSRGSPPMLGPS